MTFDGTTLTYTSDGNPLSDILIQLQAFDDVLVEGNEDYQIEISNPASTTGGEIQTTTATTVTTEIVDNDGAVWSLAGDTVVSESGTASYTLTLAGVLQNGETASIDLGISDVDTNPSDYSNFVAAVNAAIAGRPELSFDGTTLTYVSDGSPLSDIQIDLPAIDDALIEGPESYSVSIANSGSGTGSDIGTAGTTSVTTQISDNDQAIWSISGDTTVGEGNDAQYTISLSGLLQAGETATIDLDLADVDTNSADYSSFVAAVNAAIAGRMDLNFDGTTLTYTGDGSPFVDLVIELPTIDDQLSEGSEQFTVSISNPASTSGGSVSGSGQVLSLIHI